ncbi:hypothetical protein [Asanoa sp. NPDC050611]|uniref:hypothetical protein n=1 Tax=Asanoa sp. NPDC050611 TaxID=3157098 RepID=UPI0033CF259C
MGWLRRMWVGRTKTPAALITGVAGVDEDGGWTAFFISGGGPEPVNVRGGTLTEVVDVAADAVAGLYAVHPPVEGAELQLAIYPWDYHGGPIFEVAGQPGSFSARDIQGTDLAVHGATLEELVTAVERLPASPAGNAMLLWIRPVAALPAPVQES